MKRVDEETSLSARFGFWLLLVLLLAFLFIFYRKRFHQVVLIVGISTVIEVLVRLTHLDGADESGLEWEGLFLAGIAILYGIVWLAGKYFAPEHELPRKPGRKRAASSRHR